MVWLGWSKLPGSWKASQPPGASQPTQEVEQFLVAGDPLQHGVAGDHVHRLPGLPGPDVGQPELQPAGRSRGPGTAAGFRTRFARAARYLRSRGFRPGGLDHLRRVVHAQHAGARPARGQRGGQVARAAAQVGHERRVVGADPAEQVEERARPLVAEPEVGPWIPHAARRFLSTSRYLTGPVYRGHTLDVKRYAARMDEQPAGPSIAPRVRPTRPRVRRAPPRVRLAQDQRPGGATSRRGGRSRGCLAL